MITFEESSHTYLLRIGDEIRRVPSITQILDNGTPYPNNGAAERGNRIHAEINKGSAGEEVADDVKPYMDQYWDWVFDFNVMPILCEQIVFSQKYFIVGRFDMLAETNKGIFLIDFKTGTTVPKWAKEQTAAYLHCAREYLPEHSGILKKAQRLVLHLTPHEYMVKIHHRQETDFASFLRYRKAFEAR